MIGRGKAAAALCLAALALASAGGCASTSQAFPYERDFVWTVALAEASVWRPTLIDEQQYRIISEKTDLAGTEVTWKLQLEPDLNPFAPRPSTRVVVSIVRNKPSSRHFPQQERRFLEKLGASLEAMAGPRRR